jgi:hypothetical protein
MKWLLWLPLGIGLIIILGIGLQMMGSNQWNRLIRTHKDQLEATRVQNRSIRPNIIHSTRYDVREIEGLPPPVQRYFRAVLQDGQPIISAATIEMEGTINMSATAEQWKPFTSEQRVVTFRPGFIWNAKVSMYPGVSAHVEDSYISGQGQLIAKLAGIFSVADVHGGGELARGEFMRYFAEAVWYPTALLPSQGVLWQALDDTSAYGTITDGPTTLTLLFKFNELSLISSVHAALRGAGIGKEMVMLPWNCQLSNYQLHHAMLIPMTGEVSWLRPQGRKPYFVGNIKKINYEIVPQ